MNPSDCDSLFKLLISFESSNRTFNQYRDVNLELDLPQGAAIRLHNLQCYLETFAGAGFVLVGEAAGYAGCRFSGIPFTCEAQFVGKASLTWAISLDLGRSSTASAPWSERSAQMVWQALGERTDCVLWNAFPWHPLGVAGPLSNRPPGRELQQGLETLCCFLSLFPTAQPFAVGRAAQRALAAIGTEAPYIRHPSRGGKRPFLEGVAALGQD